MAFYRGPGGTGTGSVTTLPVQVSEGGTGATTAADARTNLGLSTMALQSSTNVSITGGTVTGVTGVVNSVNMTVPTGLSVSGGPITSTGTFAVTFASGYSIPTTSAQSNWNTAYGWGDHSAAGYLSNLVEDLTPQLGGDLDVNGNIISSSTGPTVLQAATDYNIELSAAGDGDVILTTENGDVSIAGSIWPTTYGSANQVLSTDGAGNLSWATVDSGGVSGPVSSTDNAVVRFDGANGDTVQDSSVTISDTGVLTTPSLVVDTTTLVVDAAANRIGIGTASPTDPVHVVNSTPGIKLESSASNAAYTTFKSGTLNRFYIGTESNAGTGIIAAGQSYAAIVATAGTNHLILGTNNAERMRIDGSTGTVSIGGNTVLTTASTIEGGTY